MIPRFAHARPAQLDEAFDAYDAADGEGTYYAGGTELLQVMKAGFAQFSTLIDLKRVEGLDTISVDDDGWLRIGGTVTHRRIETSEVVAGHTPALLKLIRGVANVRVRNTGTLGGNLAFAEPHSDPAAFLLACEAEVELAGPDDRRRLSIDEFVVGPLFTSREPEEVLTAVLVPPAAPGMGRAYRKIAFFERPAASVGVRLSVADGRIDAARVTVGSLTDVPLEVEALASELTGVEASPDALAAATAEASSGLDTVEVVGDHNGSADFKRHLAGQLLGQAASEALEEAIASA